MLALAQQTGRGDRAQTREGACLDEHTFTLNLDVGRFAVTLAVAVAVFALFGLGVLLRGGVVFLGLQPLGMVSLPLALFVLRVEVLQLVMDQADGFLTRIDSLFGRVAQLFQLLDGILQLFGVQVGGLGLEAVKDVGIVGLRGDEELGGVQLQEGGGRRSGGSGGGCGAGTGAGTQDGVGGGVAAARVSGVFDVLVLALARAAEGWHLALHALAQT